MEGTQFGQYQLASLLGRGGMGEVWRAYDTLTDRVVALKVLPADLAGDEAFDMRFRREARAAAGLHEPHVIPIHGYGEIDGRFYVDMRLILGENLEQLLREGPLAPARAVTIVEQVALALHAAHGVGLIHRDVKPSNILVTAADYAYLIDFGIARSADETRMTGRDSLIGTWAYMAPELFGDNDIDSRSDVYALACVLYEALTGQRPFPGDGMERQVVGHLSSPPPIPSAVNGLVPPALDEVIATGMAKSPDERYASTIELAAAARHALTIPIADRPPATAAEPASPRPTLTRQRLADPSVHAGGQDGAAAADPPTRRPRRRLVLAGVGAAAVLAVVAVVVALTWPTSTPTRPASRPSPPPGALVEGDPSAPVNKLAVQAAADLEKFWTDQFPKVYGKDYQPVAGGLYAMTPGSKSGSACAPGYGDITGTALYCGRDDSVTWDASQFLPALQAKYGDFVVPVVLASQWGHAVQHRSGYSDQNKLPVSSDLQADCFAGAWAKHAQDDKVFDVSSGELDSALAGILSLKDKPGTTSTGTQDAHGSGFDRVSAFQDGYDNTVAKCKGYKDGDPQVLELPFTSEVGAARGGDAPYAMIVDNVPSDMEDYWTQVYPDLSAGRKWQPLNPDRPFDPANPPVCGGQSVKGYRLFYCIPDDYIGWDNVDTMPAIYDRSGDYAVVTLLATQYGLAALDQLGDKSAGKTSSLRGDCLAGSYTASVMLQNRKATSSFSISPGDLDEGIAALLVPIDPSAVNPEGQGTGFERTRAFRTGLVDGVQPCLTYGA